MATDICDDSCLKVINTTHFEELYDLINTKVRADLQDDYDCKKINGATYADTWSKMMSPAVGQIMGAMVELKMKETSADRLLKEAQVNLTDAQTTEVPLESARRDCNSQSDCDFHDAQEAEILKESTRRDLLNTEQILASGIKSTNETCVSTADCELKDAQELKIEYETSDILPANKDMIVRQKEGFDDNLRQKLFDSQMNSWAMMYSSGLLEDKPSIISNDEVSGLYNSIKDEVDQYLGFWDVSISYNSVTEVVSWGTVQLDAGDTATVTYELEIINAIDGMESGYPTAVAAADTEAYTLPDASTESDNAIIFNINAKDTTGRTTFSSLTVRIPKSVI